MGRISSGESRKCELCDLFCVGSRGGLGSRRRRGSAAVCMYGRVRVCLRCGSFDSQRPQTSGLRTETPPGPTDEHDELSAVCQEEEILTIYQ